MNSEALSFSAFLVISFGWHAAAHVAEKVHAKFGVKVRVPRSIGYVAVPLIHPQTLEAVREYLVHLVVYSGLVLPAH